MGSNSEKKSSLLPKLIVVLIVIIVLGVITYLMFTGKQETVVSTSNETTTANKEMSAEDIVNALKEKNENIGKVVVYTAETDTNNLLGRPNQYISKVNFADNRISQEFVDENDAKGGTIEVFTNKEDMKKRKEYIEQISSSASMFAQYIYSKGNALLRIEKDLTPEQAKEYESVFNEIVK